MDYAQLESRITFLDEQYRREKEEITQLRFRLERSEAEKGDLMGRIAALESELAAVKSELPKIELMDNRNELFKSEIVSSLDRHEGRQRQVLKDLEVARQAELEVHTKAINDVRREVERSRNLDELISLARAEAERQADSISDLGKRLDTFINRLGEQIHRITYLEEQRRTDGQRVNALQVQLNESFRPIPTQLAKIELLEKQLPQFGKFQSALEEVRDNVRLEVEKVQYQQAEVDRKVKTWHDISDLLERRIADYESRLERYAEQYQHITKAVETLHTFQERIQHEQHEFSELQRLNFDRLRSDTEAWQKATEEALQKQYVNVDREVEVMQREIAKLEPQIQDVAVKIPPVQSQVDLLLKILEEDILTRSVTAREWQTRFEQLATEGEG